MANWKDNPKHPSTASGMHKYCIIGEIVTKNRNDWWVYLIITGDATYTQKCGPQINMIGEYTGKEIV